MSADLVDDADLRVYLETASAGAVAWLANYLTRKPTGYAWPGRETAIAAILTAARTLSESDPRRGVIQRLQVDPPCSALGGTLDLPCPSCPGSGACLVCGRQPLVEVGRG